MVADIDNSFPLLLFSGWKFYKSKGTRNKEQETVFIDIIGTKNEKRETIDEINMSLQLLTIQNWLQHHATYRSEHLAIVFESKRLTYHQLHEEVSSLVNAV